MKHPAPFSAELIPHLIEACDGFRRGVMLDPFAGIGRGKQVADALEMRFIGIEIEQEWAIQGQGVILGDSSRLVDYVIPGSIDVVCTSPAYGNRMADSYAGSPKDREHAEATGKIRRRTYRISLGRPLTKGNGGAFHFGREYKHLHRDVWAGCFRVLKPGGILVLNISDHVRKGVEVPVTDWHVSTLQDLGFMLEDVVAVTTRRFREGQNGDKRMENEWIIKLRRPGDVVDADRRDHFDRVR